MKGTVMAKGCHSNRKMAMYCIYSINTKGMKDSVWKCLFLHRSVFIFLDCNNCFMLEAIQVLQSLDFWKPPAFFPCLVKPVLSSWPLFSFKPSHSHKCVSAPLGNGEGRRVDSESQNMKEKAECGAREKNLSASQVR